MYKMKNIKMLLMYKIIAVISSYKSSKIAPSLAKDVIKLVDKLICVDDCCPDFIGSEIRRSLKSEKIDFIFHESNKGIGFNDRFLLFML